jgi:hypothetical protein
MPGKKGRSGRPRGSLSWTKNPAALAGHELNVAMEMWLAGAPVGSLAPPTTRRFTVPVKVKRPLATLAIQHVIRLYPGLQRPTVDQVIAWTRRRAPSGSLRRRSSDVPRDDKERAYQEVEARDRHAWKECEPIDDWILNVAYSFF